MYNAIYCEFLKIKRSPIFLVLIIGALAEPLLMLWGQIFRRDIVEWDSYMGNIEAMTFLVVGLLLFTLVASYIYTREFTERVAYTTYAYPLSKTKVFICKLITVFACIAFVYIFQFVAILITGSIIDHEPLAKDFLILNIKIYCYSMLFQFTIAPLGILMGSISRNLIVPMAYSVIGTIVTISIAEFNEGNIYFPLYYPAMPVMSAAKNNMRIVINNQSIVIAVVFFIITFTICIIYYERSDIY
ncbi:bacitracin transport system permease protein [Clostridium tetanomorphum]|uniref:ABC transporter permease subunit n=1 Tax=Clostridium tetanomorphum TaxID=1553 RepID=A0A923IZ79_CLOTT|nr:ABC transporter permease [Clostridium tetanomorphum]KAJ50972.1 membrane spanning protein [Clostridium tetanomorphum DSM 665]MBC2396339.1 ABC transporter permease subunit [Clostridium tetanomorphum]MBP1863432.1 bacitracin transport system permease protein [Clostridium tetanomorphum]NRS83529.1 bacitracin transport system permease protein [Clostridium tetanomorphum]NRZ96729.1 bacitracin transport system permease protein [Clostridium tetanomorphum]